MTLHRYNPNDQKFAKVLIFAPAGHGKTVFLGTAQEDERTYPMCLLDWEAGSEVLDGLDIDVFPIRSWRDADVIIEHLERGDEAKIDDEWIDFSEYRSVGVDSISEWNRWAQLERLKLKGPSRNDPDLLEFQDYNTTGVQLRRVLRRLRDLPVHLFLSAHAKSVEDPRLKRIIIPDLTGQLAEEIAGLVSTVGYLALSEDEDGEAERLLLLHDYPKYRTKVRTKWRENAPSEIVNPDVTEILNALGYSKNNRNGKE